jgi:uncharacterized protein
MLRSNSFSNKIDSLLVLALLVGPTSVRAADYAPINCGKTSSPTERTICRSYPLGQAEARMATLFGVVNSLVAMGQRGDIGDAQRKWLKDRNACGDDTTCLARAYQSRIDALSAVLDTVASHGPF